MRRTFTAALLVSCALASACGGGQAGSSNNARPAAQSNSSQKEAAANTSNASNSSTDVGIASSHRGGSAAPAAGGGPADKPPATTPELDAGVQKAEAKVKAGGVSESDKKAAAEAYFARADYYREQGMPQLYRFALADYRRGLRLDPSNSDAREKMDEIVQIYKSMGRPVPELGNEQ